MENEDPFVEQREERRYKRATATMEAVSMRIGDLGFLGLFFKVLWIAIDIVEKWSRKRFTNRL